MTTKEFAEKWEEEFRERETQIDATKATWLKKAVGKALPMTARVEKDLLEMAIVEYALMFPLCKMRGDGDAQINHREKIEHKYQINLSDVNYNYALHEIIERYLDNHPTEYVPLLGAVLNDLKEQYIKRLSDLRDVISSGLKLGSEYEEVE
jgi:hypothetical protein